MRACFCEVDHDCAPVSQWCEPCQLALAYDDAERGYRDAIERKSPERSPSEDYMDGFMSGLALRQSS